MNEHPALTFVSLSRSQTQFFEQLSDEEFWRYANEGAHFVPSLQCQAEDYLVCSLGARHCIFPLATLGEIVSPPQQLTLLPSVPSWILGLTTWRNEVIVVVGLESYLLNGVKYTEITSIVEEIPSPSELLLVVQFKDVTIGLIVTVVNKTMHFDEKRMVPFELAPDWCSSLPSGVIKGIMDDALVLDVPFLCSDIIRKIKEPVSS